VPAETPEPRRCPVCSGQIAGAARYCSPACKTAGWRQANPGRPAGPSRRKASQPPATGALPTALRDCPHCGELITIVALLTTPQIAGPQLPTSTPDAVPLRAVPTT
jgi:hypothetical protein